MPAALVPQSLHHIALATRDPEISAEFYTNVVGMRRIARPQFSFRGAWLYHAPGRLQLHLIEHASAQGVRGQIDTLAPHFALVVDDLDSIEHRLKQHHIPYKRQVNAAGFEQIFFQDPDGNCLEFGIYPEEIEGNGCC